MAIMKRGQKAAAQGWAATAKMRKDANKDKEMESKEVSPAVDLTFLASGGDTKFFVYELCLV